MSNRQNECNEGAACSVHRTGLTSVGLKLFAEGNGVETLGFCCSNGDGSVTHRGKGNYTLTKI